jgi:hypothetical protein
MPHRPLLRKRRISGRLSTTRALSYRIAMVVLFVAGASPIFSVTGTAFPLGALSGIRQLS